MPLVQELQNKLGKDKVGVLLLSIDEEYGSHQAAVEGMKEALQSKSVDLPVAFAPGGFADTRARFGIDGYGIMLVGPDGTVIGKDLFVNDLERMIQSR